MDVLELTGRSRTHVEQLDDLRVALHRSAVAPFLALREAAAREGLDIRPHSGFRDFDAQVAIWNRKYRGERPLYDRNGSVRDHASLGPQQLVDAILVWSAVPGASRHHWGSEIDVFDAAAMPEGYRVQLLPEEYASGGIFEKLAGWLDENLQRFDFFRPYDRDRGGVYPEPWHISYAPVSAAALGKLTPEVIADALKNTEVLGKELVLSRLPDIWRSYVVNISHPMPTAALGGDANTGS
jgi:LAS superfamily LD-carboxypeptidase LdcB